MYVNPRRRHLRNPVTQTTPLQPSSSPNAPTTLAHSHSLRKSATFHSPTSPRSEEHDPILSIPSLPRRSPTCHKTLEATLAAGDDRIAQIIGAVDRSLSGLQSFSSDSQETLVAEGLPVPLFMVNTNVDAPDRMELDQQSPTSQLQPYHPQAKRKHHHSDSGIGSTVSSSELSMSGDHAGVKQGMTPASKLVVNDSHWSMKDAPHNVTSVKEGRVQTGINGLNASTAGSVTGTQHALSEYACKQIQKHIILPIIREEKLKDFHPLVNGIPYRVARKEITCLRDLEKVLLWLAPVSLHPSLWVWSLARGLILGEKKWSVSKASFLSFCETSIQCIHTTVDFLNEHDQRRPADRPYTNGYFLDLVEQVRQYATMLSASRATMASGPSASETERASYVPLALVKFPSDAFSDEHLDLVGGLSQTGRPVELVRVKDGRSILLRTGEDVSAETLTSYQRGIKRSVSEEAEEDVLRSMARRKASALPVVKDIQKCSECDKVFKRPCDLT